MSITQQTPQTRQDGRCGALTPDQVLQYGYTPIPTYPRSRAIAPCWKPGYGIDVAAGLQADGTYLHLLDLDSHTPGQDATAQLTRIQKRVGPDLAARLAIRRSRSGRGYHIPYRTATPHSEHASIRVFDPLRPEHHIGELIGPSQRVTLTGEWIQHGPDAIPLLTASELSLLRAAIHTPALYAPQDAPGSPQNAPGSHTPRKERMAEGLSLIAGWERVINVQHRLDGLAAGSEQLTQRWLDLRRNPDDRSKAYSRFVQSLMLHAAGLGRDLAERCRVVAAMAIHVGAAGKEHERTYKIVNDTAALIARILHGDAHVNDPERHFTIPHWVQADPPPARPSPLTRAQSAERTPHPHARSRQKNVKKLLRYVRTLPQNEYSQRFTSLDDLAYLLGVSTRTVQSYLNELRATGAISSGQDGGNGALFIILRDPPKAAKNPRRHEGCAANEPQAAVENHSQRDDHTPPALPVLAPDVPPETTQCTEVLGPPKGSAPAACEVGDDLAGAAGAVIRPLAGDQAEPAGAKIVPLPDDLADATRRTTEPMADDLADAPGANFVPVAEAADEAPAVVLALADDQAEESPAIVLALADDQADILPPRDELVCRAELSGPAGALVVVGGAAYVPPVAEPWYAAICAAIAPPLGKQPDDQAETMQLVASLDDQADDLEAIGAGDVPEGDDQIAGTPAKRVRRRRKCKDPKRKKLDERRQEVERWRRMDLPRLEIERSKLVGASQDCERPPQQRETLAKKVRQIDVEIGRKRSAGIQAMYQAANDTTRPPLANEQAGPVMGVVRRSWRSLIARCDWEPEPFVPREVAPREHPIATLGTDPEAMRAAHEYCAAMLARAGEG